MLNLKEFLGNVGRALRGLVATVSTIAFLAFVLQFASILLEQQYDKEQSVSQRESNEYLKGILAENSAL